MDIINDPSADFVDAEMDIFDERGGVEALPGPVAKQILSDKTCKPLPEVKPLDDHEEDDDWSPKCNKTPPDQSPKRRFREPSPEEEPSTQGESTQEYPPRPRTRSRRPGNRSIKPKTKKANPKIEYIEDQVESSADETDVSLFQEEVKKGKRGKQAAKVTEPFPKVTRCSVSFLD
jgi:hypothetical protein